MVQSHDLGLAFEEKVIFEKLNFRIEKSSNVCISGPSGKGKSSLLKILQGYITHFTGKLEVNGLSLNANNILKIRNQISWIPQNIHLPVNNGLELMVLLETSSQKEQAIVYLKKLGLEESYLSKDFSEISGGQKQRIVIAICLSSNKELILMDEPTSSLDDDSIVLLIDLIKSLKEKTIVSASHNNQWLQNADQIIAL